MNSPLLDLREFLLQPYVLDYIIIFLLLCMFFIGFTRKLYLQSFHFIITIICLFVGLAFTKMAGEWVLYDSFEVLKIQPTVSNGIDTQTINSFKELFLYENNILLGLSYDNDYVTQLATGVSNSMGNILIIICVSIASPILTVILWFSFKAFIPKKAQVHNKRILGGLLGLLQGIIILIICEINFSSFAPTYSLMFENIEAAIAIGHNANYIVLFDILSPSHLILFNWCSFGGELIMFTYDSSTYKLAPEFYNFINSSIESYINV